MRARSEYFDAPGSQEARTIHSNVDLRVPRIRVAPGPHLPGRSEKAVLLSELFKGNQRLAACLAHDVSHILQGAVGDHVAKIQMALFVVDSLGINADEISARHYGPSTANAVLAFKTKRKIINLSYQTRADNIVGRMTIAALDRELFRKQGPATGRKASYCGNDLTGLAPAAVASAGPRGSRQRQFIAAPFGAHGPSPSPKGVALSRVSDAKTVVGRTRAVLAGLIAFRPGPQGVVPIHIRKSFDMVWAHFGIPKNMPFTPFGRSTVNNLQDFLGLIDQVYDQMEKNLVQASGIFFDSPEQLLGPDTFAFTLSPTTTQPPQLENSPHGIYFNPRFLKTPRNSTVGPRKQIEVVVHECAHFPNTTFDIEDLQIPGQPGYSQEKAEKLVNNAYSYSQFALNVVFGRSLPFDDDE